MPGAFANTSIIRMVLVDTPIEVQTDYGKLISSAANHGMGVFAIRVLAGGALAGLQPSPRIRAKARSRPSILDQTERPTA